MTVCKESQEEREAILKEALMSQPHVTYLSRSKEKLLNSTKIYIKCAYHGEQETSYRKVKNRKSVCAKCTESLNRGVEPIKVGSTYDVKEGKIKVVSYTNASAISVEFLGTGSKTTTSAASIRKGSVRDPLRLGKSGVGFIGTGMYKSCIGDRDDPAYSCWKNMIRRCYDEDSLKRHPSYRGTTVCEEWENYQNFAKWYYENNPDPYKIEGVLYQLDKDINAVSTDKVYSPLYCTFVINQVNSEVALAKNYKFIAPCGDLKVIYTLNKFCRNNNLTAPAMYNVHSGKATDHKGWTKFIE